MKTDCVFCEEFVDKSKDNQFLSIFGDILPTRVIYETEHFVVVPSIGQLVEGYLLIVPRGHYLSIGHLPQTLLLEFEKLQKLTKSILTDAYTSPILFEHGPVSEKQHGGCCVDHAHLHLVPANVDLRGRLDNLLPSKSILSFAELALETSSERPYLYYESQNGDRSVYPATGVPSQLLRKVLAQELGIPDQWDWLIFPGKERLVRTYVKLVRLFNKASQ
jgi:diadenosine tetraphosphate (Ap4A) HIT family hydrolase